MVRPKWLCRLNSRLASGSLFIPRGLIGGVRTLEMDNGITKFVPCSCFLLKPTLRSCSSFRDGVVLVWHDEDISNTKCQDTKPAVRALSHSAVVAPLTAEY